MIDWAHQNKTIIPPDTRRRRHLLKILYKLTLRPVTRETFHELNQLKQIIFEWIWVLIMLYKLLFPSKVFLINYVKPQRINVRYFVFGKKLGEFWKLYLISEIRPDLTLSSVMTMSARCTASITKCEEVINFYCKVH